MRYIYCPPDCYCSTCSPGFWDKPTKPKRKKMNHSTDTARTQLEALSQVRPLSVKERIREHLIAKGPATPEQIAEATGLHYRSVQPRISELLRDGLIYTTGVMTETTLRRKSAEVAAYIG